MKQKVLSLCFPTYNRGWCMQEQIFRLRQCPQNVLDSIEILISDNCSSDNTQQIVEDAINDGFECRYIRNHENLGMDGNFVSCFKKATGKYIWLLGDDDIIRIEQLAHLVKVLSRSTEFGLIHIMCHGNKIGTNTIIEVSDKSEMIKSVSYYVTFISANIVNGKYVKDIDFDRYMGTFFTLMPLYITAIMNSSFNCLIFDEIFEPPKDYSRNGGYNFFEVFVHNYLTIWSEFLYDRQLLKWLKKDIFPFINKFVRQLLIRKEKGNYITSNGWNILLRYYGFEWYFWWFWLKFPWGVIKRRFLSLSNELTTPFYRGLKKIHSSMK